LLNINENETKIQINKTELSKFFLKNKSVLAILKEGHA